MNRKLPKFGKSNKGSESYTYHGSIFRKSNLKPGPKKVGFWRWLKDSSDQLKLIAALIAGFYAAFEYKAKDYNDKVKTSTEVVDKFLNNDDSKALVELEDFWLNEHSLGRNLLEDASITSSEFRKRVDAKLRSEKRTQILKVIRGLKGVSVCGIQGRCDTNTLCFYLADRIQDFRCNFRESLAVLSADNGSCITDEINYLVDNYCSEWMASNSGVREYRGIEDNICLFDKRNNKNLLGESCSNSIVNRKTDSFFLKVLH